MSETTGDKYNRIDIGNGRYRCGCYWTSYEKGSGKPRTGDVLVECPIHKAATKASVTSFDRERK